jgi:anti-sigma factor RsiW
MKRQLSPKDWQLLSDYMDEQLSARQKEDLEKRLQTSAELRQGLQEMHQTRAILRSVPRLKVPHNFTLTRAMAAEARQRSPWMQVLSFSSILSLVVVIITVLFQLLPSALPMAAQAPMVAMKAAAPEALPTQAGAATEPPIINWVPATGKGGGPGPSDSEVQPGAPTAAEKLAVPNLTPQPTEAPQDQNRMPQATSEATTEPSNAQPPVPAATVPAAGLNPPPTQTPSVERESAAPQESGPILGLPSKDDEGQIQAYSATEQPIQSTEPGVNYLFLFQVVLVVIAVSTGIAAILIKRKT